MSTLALSQHIGKLGSLQTDKLRFDVRIIDVKLSYGNVRYLVTPVSGTGQVWVDSSRVQIKNEEQEMPLLDKEMGL